jgi:hypothetical protein
MIRMTAGVFRSRFFYQITANAGPFVTFVFYAGC